ncbi:MAG: P-loop NTPase [Firmicutes bacterium]|nr:P-loop NTPase [Bacillota bacterium]
MLIAVASGKGGTGKTTVAVNLALTLQNKLPVTLLDCDVEEPNAHLFLQPAFTKQEKVLTTMPVVDDTRCDGCGQCSVFCAFNAIAMVERRPMIFPELCHGCGGCSLACPTNAISEVSREIGRVDIGNSYNIQMSRGYLQIGSPLAPLVVGAVRETAPWDHSSKAIIIDAPPGTSCAVVAAAQNTDFCLLVTEPTPFGLNDLRLAVELAKKLELPHGVVINRAGLGDRGVYDYCHKKRLPILMEIPFDKKYAACYARGGQLVEEFADLKSKFARLWDQIQALGQCTTHPTGTGRG